MPCGKKRNVIPIVCVYFVCSREKKRSKAVRGNVRHMLCYSTLWILDGICEVYWDLSEIINASFVSEDFSSCFSNVVSDFLMNRINFVGGDKLLPVFKHDFLRSEENVFPAIFLHTKCVWANIFLYNFEYLCMVGSITIHVGRCYCHILPTHFALWQMLLPWQMLLLCFVCCFFYWGWCFYLIIEWITCMNKCKKMLKLGWWYCQYYVVDVSNHWGRCYYLILYMLGWCYCLLLLYVAGVMPPDFAVYWIGWCYCPVAGGIATAF